MSAEFYYQSIHALSVCTTKDDKIIATVADFRDDWQEILHSICAIPQMRDALKVALTEIERLQGGYAGSVCRQITEALKLESGELINYYRLGQPPKLLAPKIDITWLEGQEK